jgi:hypothetical protein
MEINREDFEESIVILVVLLKLLKVVEDFVLLL